MIFAAVHRFPPNEHGHPTQRDADALPRYLLCDIDLDHHEAWFHPAGDDYIRTRCVIDALHDRDFIDGFTPADAVQIALEYARALQMGADREIAPLEEETARSES